MKLEDNYYVYILLCSDNTYYTGITNNLEKRLKDHNSGKGSKYTKYRIPVIMIYSKLIGNRSKASKEEYRIKKLNRKQKEYLILQK